MRIHFRHLLMTAAAMAIGFIASPTNTRAAATSDYVWISDSVVVRSADAQALDSLAKRLALSPKETTPFDSVESVPIMLKESKPVYPQKAKSQKLEAEIWVQALVGIDGIVRMARILKGDINQKTAGMGFEKSALTAAMKTTYKPAKVNDKPVQTWVTYKVTFVLK